MSLDSKWEKVKNNGHYSPSPETRERLAKLETNQNNFMTEIQEIKQLIKELGVKLENAIMNKADKKDLECVKDDVENLKNWKWKMAGVMVVVVFLIYLLKDLLLKII